MEQPDNDLSEAMGQLSVAADDSDETPKNLGDMPHEVAALIIQRSDFKEQLILRKTSRALRELVDDEKPACTHLSIRSGPICKSSMGNNSSAQIEFNDFGFTLKNPKLELEKFVVYHNIQPLMESINDPVSVRELELRAQNPSCLLSILPFLKPGVLEQITISADKFRWSADAMHPVARLEQWIRCEEMHLHWAFDKFPMEYAQHFKRFVILEGDIDDTKFVRFRNYLCGLQNLEKCTLVCMGLVTKREEIQPLMRTLIESDGKDVTYHYRIPETNYYLEMKLSENPIRMDIEKKRRPN